MRKQNSKKKILVCVLLLVVLSGCSGLGKNQEDNSKQETVKNNEEKDYKEPYVDDNPILLGLYLNQSGTRNLISSYDSPLTQYQDIVSFDVYFTNEEVLTGNQKDLWSYYYQNYQDIDTYKIGYQISFKTDNLEVNQMILNPSDVGSFFDYIQVYLYDDIHQDGGWYDHVSQEEVTDETRFTSIKLTASTKIAEIISPITLTVFTYDSDDFDENGNYRGKSSYQVVINRR